MTFLMQQALARTGTCLVSQQVGNEPYKKSNSADLLASVGMMPIKQAARMSDIGIARSRHGKISNYKKCVLLKEVSIC